MNNTNQIVLGKPLAYSAMRKLDITSNHVLLNLPEILPEDTIIQLDNTAYTQLVSITSHEVLTILLLFIDRNLFIDRDICQSINT